MTSIIPIAKFGYGHPFWQTAVEMRQACFKIQEILDRAWGEGYVDLKYHHIQHALSSAPADLHLPTVTSKALKRRYDKVVEDFNSFEIMKLLSLDALSEIAELEEELTDPELSSSRRISLEGQLWRLKGRTFDWARECSELVVRLQALDPRAHPIVSDSRAEDAQKYLDTLVSEFHRALPAGRNDNLIDLYGAENIRLPNALVEESDGLDEDEDY